MSAQPKYTPAWWRTQPLEPLVQAVTRFEAEKDTLGRAERQYLERHLPPLEIAQQIDRDMNRLLGH